VTLSITAIEGARPFAVDGWTVITDREGFLAIQKELAPGSMPLAPVSDRDASTTRKLLALSAGPIKTSLQSLREFVNGQLPPVRLAPIRCCVLGCVVDAWLLKKWLDAIPFTECSIGCNQIDMAQGEKGGCLILEGGNWKIVIAGLRTEPTATMPHFGAQAQGGAA